MWGCRGGHLPTHSAEPRHIQKLKRPWSRLPMFATHLRQPCHPSWLVLLREQMKGQRTGGCEHQNILHRRGTFLEYAELASFLIGRSICKKPKECHTHREYVAFGVPNMSFTCLWWHVARSAPSFARSRTSMSQAKVNDSNLWVSKICVFDHDVRLLDVTMHKPMLVDVIQANEALFEDISEIVLAQVNTFDRSLLSEPL